MAYEELLAAAGAEILEFKEFGSYQGDWWAKVLYDGHQGWVRGYYGSCSGCDSFQAEFGYGGDRCEEHQYDYIEAPKTCPGCREASKQYEEKLVAFGKNYLDEMMTQDEAEAKASENLDWDWHAREMLDWIQANAI